ncbi:MAG: NUDIX domain-containing protein [Patescibacteria group bacterium]
MGNEGKNLKQEIEELIGSRFKSDELASKFIERINQGGLTIEENPESHFCAYFSAYDPDAKQIFIGHHKKSGLWLINGGHIDKGEIIKEALKREIDEEWGLDFDNFNIKKPALLTITEIYNPEKQPCRVHYDIWHFVPVDKNKFNPDASKLSEEFYENKWLSADEAGKITTDPNTIKAIDFIKNNLF